MYTPIPRSGCCRGSMLAHIVRQACVRSGANRRRQYAVRTKGERPMRMPVVELGTPVGLTRGFTRILRAARGAISPLWLALLALALLAVLLSAVPGALTVRSDAVSARIRLEQELIRAHDQLSIPSYLLQPVADGERRVRTSAGPLDAGGEAAAASYTRLQRQLQTIEATS